MTTSAKSLVMAVTTGGVPSRAALTDYGLDSNPHFNHPDPSVRELLFSYYTFIVNNGVTAELLHVHLKAKTLHELLGEYINEDDLKKVLVDGRIKNVYESFP